MLLSLHLLHCIVMCLFLLSVSFPYEIECLEGEASFLVLTATQHQRKQFAPVSVTVITICYCYSV